MKARKRCRCGRALAKLLLPSAVLPKYHSREFRPAMPRKNLRSVTLLAVMPALLLLWSCQQDVQDGSSVDSGRSPVDALDRDTANARKARISNLEYEVLIDLVSGESEFSGDVTLRFDLSDISTALTIDFTGG